MARSTGLKLFAALTKVDESRREVHGRLAQEVGDHSGEIMDYATSKPLFQSWSAEFEKATNGQSVGNVRAMHGNVAAGKFIQMVYDDVAKAVDVVAKIVDDAEWQKCLEGVYTGFSIGGKYVKRWADGKLTRYTAQPFEGSLVDAPCIPTATFAMVKMDGATEQRPFQSLGVLRKVLDNADLTVGETLDFMAEYLPGDEVETLTKNTSTTMGDVRDALRKFVAAAPVPMTPEELAKKAADDAAADEAKKVAERTDTSASEGEDKYGKVVYADETNKKYPINTKAHVRAALSYWGVEKNRAKYSAADQKTIGAKIHAAAKKFGIDVSADDASKWLAEAGLEKIEVKKGLYSVQTFASLLQSIAWLTSDAEYEAISEGDGSAVPDKIKAWLRDGVGIFHNMSMEETAELLNTLGADALEEDVDKSRVLLVDALRKAGARHSKADRDSIQAIHDHASNLGADCGDMDETEKAARGELNKRTNDELSKKLEDVLAANEELQKRVKALEDQPAAPKGVVRVVTKTADNTPEDQTVEKIELPTDPGERALAVMKLVQAAPAAITTK